MSKTAFVLIAVLASAAQAQSYDDDDVAVSPRVLALRPLEYGETCLGLPTMKSRNPDIRSMVAYAKSHYSPEDQLDFIGYCTVALQGFAAGVAERNGQKPGPDDIATGDKNGRLYDYTHAGALCQTAIRKSRDEHVDGWAWFEDAVKTIDDDHTIRKACLPYRKGWESGFKEGYSPE